MKPYLIFSDETEKKLSFNSCWKNKIEETARVLEKTPKVSTPLLEYGKIAYFHFQQDQDQALFSPGCLRKELAYSWPACFENLSPSLLHKRARSRWRQRQKLSIRPSAVQLTQSGDRTDSQWSLARQMKRA